MTSLPPIGGFFLFVLSLGRSMNFNYESFDSYNVDDYEQAQEIYVPELTPEREYWEEIDIIINICVEQ